MHWDGPAADGPDVAVKMQEGRSKLWYLASPGAAVSFSALGYAYGQRATPRELQQSCESCI